MSKVVARVSCGSVELKLTLTPKFMAKSLTDAVLKPFLGAYNKRVSSPLDASELERVEVDGVEADVEATCESLLKDKEQCKIVLVAPVSATAATDDAVKRVLEARNEFEVLGLPLEQASEGAVKKAYRQVSLQVHPDKISHPRATDAFRKVFDSMKAVIEPARQKVRLEQLRADPNAAAGEASELPAEFRWWEGASVQDMEQSFRNLEEFLEAKGAFGAEQVDDNLWVEAAHAETLRQRGSCFFVDSRDLRDFEVSHVKDALALPGHTMEQLQNLTHHPTVLALFASPASLVVVYSDNGSKMSRCVNVSKILRQLLQP